MKDYIDKINREVESSSKAQESAWAMGTRLKPRINEKRVDSSVQLEASMPCFFSEEELDEEIRVSMKSGNATQREVDAVFCR